ncbi:MAG TPA: RDD family protein [Thermoanaerobaculia bacterium]
MQPLDITTPEHVHIRLEPAGAGSRFLAVMLDFLITFAIGTAVGVILMYALPQGLATAIYITVTFLLTWGWHVYFETTRGRTPGKQALSLRVIDARGLPVSLYQSLVRNIVRVVDFAPAFYGVAAVVTMLSPTRRRLGDYLADTLVIREAVPLTWRGQITERRHNSLRTPRVLRLIKHRISLEEREFLLALSMRADKMSAEARYDLMEQVASAYRRKLGIEEEQISGENFVRDLTAVVFDPTRASISASPNQRGAH